MKFELACSGQISFSVSNFYPFGKIKETNKQKNAHHNPYMFFVSSNLKLRSDSAALTLNHGYLLKTT